MRMEQKGVLLWLAVLCNLHWAFGQRRTDSKGALQYLFDRPSEPIFVPKGDNKVLFQIPNEYLVDRYKPLGSDLTNRFGDDVGERIDVQRISVPDLSLPMQLNRREHFSIFSPYHRRMARRLIDIFMGMRNVDDFLSVSLFCRDRINPNMYIYALSVAILHRPDTRNVPVPSLAEIFPDKFIASNVIANVKEELEVVTQRDRIPLEIPRDYTASDLEPEHRVAYFREDIGLNLHHWHWHLVFPARGDRSIVAKDRRGELFYYTHEQIIGRYNFERLSNKLPRVKRFQNWREPIEEAYYPKLDSLVSSRVWAPRQANSLFSDINREIDQIVFDVEDLERWRDRIFQAIHDGRVQNDRGQFLNLTERDGIDLLGNIVEASDLSINENLYGNLHGLGHLALSLVHDPDGRHLETFGVMGDLATTMRDPIFYRWHSMVDDIFQEHKSTLPTYTVQQLGFDGVRVRGVEVQSQDAPRNEFATFWQQNDVDLSRGLDFAPRGPVFARFTHLQHSPFAYRIQVENSGAPRMGTVRIFLSPSFDERGVPFQFQTQKLMFIELDKFETMLNQGNNMIQRRSTESSVSVPFERTFRRLQQSELSGQQLADFNFCGCGWPQHLLIPKGSTEGMPVQLFVMVSNHADDRVNQQVPPNTCQDAHSYCSLREMQYPDRRSMGYPFDRQPRNGVSTLAEFMTPNMFVQNMVIRFTERVAPPFPPSNATSPRPQRPSG